MTKKAQEYIKRRQAQLLGAQLVGDLPGGTVRRADGVVVPAGLAGASFVGDRMPYAKGEVRIQIRKPGDDEWETVEHDPNLVVTQAERLMANAMAGVANSAFNYIELGDPAFPANAPALGDLTLQQTTNVRKAVSVTVNGNIVTSEVTFLTSEANGFTYTEAGLFTGPFAAGSMFARKTFNPIVKTASFEMRFQWLITFLVNPASSGDCAGVSLIGQGSTTNETIYVAAGSEASVAATFDFTVGAGNIDFFINGQRMVRTRQYIEAAPALAAPIGGPAGNKGLNLVGFTLNPGDVAYLVHRTLS